MIITTIHQYCTTYDSHIDLEELVEEVEDHNSSDKHHTGDENVVGSPTQ